MLVIVLQWNSTEPLDADKLVKANTDILYFNKGWDIAKKLKGAS